MARERLTRQQAREQTRSEILDAARRLFGQHGYRRTSLEEIAESAGYSKGAVYSNWPGKEALFLELLDREFDDKDRTYSTNDLSPTTWALATLEFFVDAVNSPAMRGALAERYESARTESAQFIAGGRPDPEWATWREIASIAMATGSGLIIQSAVDPEALDPDLLQRVMARLTGSLDRADIERSQTDALS